ncbi:MAG: rod shape-determining protein MreC [Azospirillaceae bacterium]
MARIAALRAAAQRFSFLLLLFGAIAVMMVGKVDSVVVEGARERIMDAVAPILDGLSRPAATAAGMVADVQSLAELRAENAELRAEIAELQQFRDAAFRLEAENLSLRALLNYRPPEPNRYVTARVIADNSGAFVRSVAVALGTDHGVRDGMAVLGGKGLAGRVVQVGERSARVLLITDLNARIPVVVERSRDRAILGGTNTDRPKLAHLPLEAEVRVGDRIVTSGHGGMFPAGLAVGAVAAVDEGEVRVEPFADLSRLDFVRIVDFSPQVPEAELVATPGVSP